MKRVVVAQPAMREAHLPAWMRLSPRALRSSRKPVKGSRPYGNRALVSAVWPQDGLLATPTPLVVCVLSGRVDFPVSDCVLHCEAGHFILCPPETPRAGVHVQEGCDSHERCDLLWLLRVGPGILCWICHTQGSRHLPGRPEEHCFIQSHAAVCLLEALVEEAADRSPDGERLCKSLLLAFLLFLQRELRAGRHFLMGEAPNESLLSTVSDDPIAAAREHIQHHLGEPLTIEGVARRVFMSRTKFAQRFRAETGQTFTQFLTCRRLKEAKMLLSETRWSVTSIARYVGFQSDSYFRRLFHRQTGMTPLAFRRGAQSEEVA